MQWEMSLRQRQQISSWLEMEKYLLQLPMALSRRYHPFPTYLNRKEIGQNVQETVLSFQDFETADEVFMSGNMNKVTPVTAFNERQYQVGPMTRKVREMYWDWATSL